jgi:hypothetical protein
VKAAHCRAVTELRISGKRPREWKTAPHFNFMGAAFAGVQPGFYSLESFLHFAVLADGQSRRNICCGSG